MGFPRDYSTMEGKVIAKPTLWNHIEGSMIYLSEKPMLIIQDVNIQSDNGVFDIKNYREDKIESGLIILSSFSDNERALYLYKKMGFKTIGIRKKQFYMDTDYYNEILMEIWIDGYLIKNQDE